MSRFFISSIDSGSGLISIIGEDVNHIKNVLRMNRGETLSVSDGKGMDYLVEILKLDQDCITTGIIDSWASKTEPPVDITLFQGIPKSDKMDFIVQKSVELGIRKIVPVINHRTIVKFDNVKDRIRKVERWQKIALEAAKQCNRGILPEIVHVQEYAEALQYSKESELNIIPYEKETSQGLKSIISCMNPKKIGIFIGPEGGFTEDEAERAVVSGIKPVSLGPRILRTETAGIAVISIIMYEHGDMG
jgi:16S rRNA (uracil1498-N3)-methyltransferase